MAGKAWRRMARKGEGLAWIRAHLQHDGDDCLIWPFGKIPDGYPGQIRFDGRSVLAGRVMCELRNGPPPTPKHEAAHSCGKGHTGCINPRHLSWKTRGENQRDRVIHCTDNSGERNGCAKLAVGQVVEIRSLKGKSTQAAAGALFGVSGRTIGQIWHRKKWAWLP